MSAPEWVFYDAPETQNSKIKKEIENFLNMEEVVKLNALLERVADGTAIPQKDFKHLKTEGLEEVRFNSNKRTFRLLYSREKNDQLVLVALRFLQKKSQKLSRSDFETARKRLEAWRTNQKQ